MPPNIPVSYILKRISLSLKRFFVSKKCWRILGKIYLCACVACTIYLLSIPKFVGIEGSGFGLAGLSIGEGEDTAQYYYGFFSKIVAYLEASLVFFLLSAVLVFGWVLIKIILFTAWLVLRIIIISLLALIKIILNARIFIAPLAQLLFLLGYTGLKARLIKEAVFPKYWWLLGKKALIPITISVGESYGSNNSSDDKFEGDGGSFGGGGSSGRF